MTDELERQAERIIEHLLSLPATDRLAAAQQACGADAPLLKRVQSLLSAAPTVDGFLADATIDPPAEAALIEKPGTMIGRYKLLEQIGEGGFGVVFMAEQEKPVRRRVALKVIKLGMDTREVVARFEAERQALAMMDHPNIARVLDAGATETGRPYFVMELVRGLPVTEYADKYKLSTRDRVALAAQVCRAVQHAHGKGVIHRDLKPTNVLVTVTDDKPVPKVIDFGIAKATQSRLTERTLFTAHRQLIGTPQYMSPEQADSNGSDIDTRSDVYSLGVLLYELLVGTTPMDAKALRSAAFEAMRKMISQTDIPRPATRLNTLAVESQSAIAASRSTDVRQLGESLKGELDWIMMKALEKDRTRRYETASALADDLNRYLSGDAVLAGPVSGTYRLKKTLKRYKAAAIISGAIAACLLLGVAGMTWGLISTKSSERHALRAERSATDQAKLAETAKAAALTSAVEARRQKDQAEQARRSSQAIADFLTDDLLIKASPRETGNAVFSDELTRKLIEPAMATVDKRFTDQPLVRASVQVTLCRVLCELGQFAKAEPQGKSAWDTRMQLLGPDNSETLAALADYAYAIDYQGRYAEAERLNKQLWDARRRLQGDDNPDTMWALNSYAVTIGEQGRYPEAERLDKQLWDAYRRVLGDDDLGTLAVLTNYANAINQQGRYDEAERLSKQLLDAHRRVQGDDHPDTLVALNCYAITIDRQGRHAEAERLDKQLWDTRRRVLGDDHPDTLKAKVCYARAIGFQGRHAEAESLLKQSWDGYRRVLGNDHPDTLKTLGFYAETINAQSRYTEAEPLLKQCWDADRRLLGDDHQGTLNALISYAVAIDDQGRHTEAEPLLRQGLKGQRGLSPPNEETMASAESGLGRCLAQMGPTYAVEAESLLRDATAIRSKKLGPHAAPTTRSAGSLADLLDGEHHPEAAIAVRADAGLTPATAPSTK